MAAETRGQARRKAERQSLRLRLSTVAHAFYRVQVSMQGSLWKCYEQITAATPKSKHVVGPWLENGMQCVLTTHSADLQAETRV